MRKNEKTAFRPDRIGAYFRLEWLPLTFVTLTGLIYNIGLLAGPWFEGRMAQCLADILGGSADRRAPWRSLVGGVHRRDAAGAGRRASSSGIYVRRFANNINRRMKRRAVRQPGPPEPRGIGKRGRGRRA